jgi:hypothetical protein
VTVDLQTSTSFARDAWSVFGVARPMTAETQRPTGPKSSGSYAIGGRPNDFATNVVEGTHHKKTTHVSHGSPKHTSSSGGFKLHLPG